MPAAGYRLSSLYWPDRLLVLFCVIPAGLFRTTVLDEVAGDEDGDVALDTLGWDAGGVGYLWDAVAGVGGEAGENDALGGIYSLNGTDDAFVKTDNQVAREVVI